MATLNLNSGITVQGTPTQSLPELTTAAGTAIQHIQQSGVDYYIQVQNMLKTYLGYASVRLTVANSVALNGSDWSVQDFTTTGVNGESYGITADKDNDKLTLTKAGTYRLQSYIPGYYSQVSGIHTWHRSRITVAGTALNSAGEGVVTSIPSEALTYSYRSKGMAIHLGDISASSPDLEFPIWGGMPQARIHDVSLLVRAVDTPSTSGNYVTPTVTNVTASPDEVLGARNTYTGGAAADPTAYTTWDIGVSANQLLDADDVLKLSFPETGTFPCTYSDVTAIIRYSDVSQVDTIYTDMRPLIGSVDYVCSTPPEDVQVQIYAFGNGTTWYTDAGATLSAIRIS